MLPLYIFDPIGMQPSLSDPDGSSGLVAAMQWLQNALLGSVANAIAVIAVAAVGMMMFRGRIGVRHGVTVIIGCFLLFGAASIAAALRASVSDQQPNEVRSNVPIVPPSPPLPKPKPSATPGTYDPYAGASVPLR